RGYIGILIDDLVSKGVDEPYRMFTSRAEFRLHLRIDNADERLTPLGRQVGTVEVDDYQAFLAKQANISAVSKFVSENRLNPQTRAGQIIYAKLGMISGGQFQGPAALTGAQLLKRQEIGIEDLMGWINEALHLAPREDDLYSREAARRVETDFKYEGYLVQQERQMERMKRAESRRIPDGFDYKKISGLSREVVEKFTRVRPVTLGQASRIPGITPAAVSLVNVYIEIFQRRSAGQASL
ncbi:MAG: tRNA uridine-5-carboxymethylaminomethyl(34) synthesis enzyme MnmG, partial [Terriglobia bacterium]